MSLHIPSIFLMTIMVSATLTIAIGSVAVRRQRDGLWLWAVALALQTVTFILLALRGQISDFISIVLANTLGAAAFVVFTEGLFQFQQRRPPRWLIWLPCLLIPVSFHLLMDDTPARVILGGIIFGAQSLFLLVTLLQQNHQTQGRGKYMLAAGMVGLVAVFTIRAIGTAGGSADMLSLMESNAIQSFTFLIYASALVLLALGLAIMVKERTQHSLQETLAETQRFRDALDQISSIVSMKDAESRYVYGNQAALKLLGVSAEELQGSDYSRYFNPKTAGILRAIDLQVLAGRNISREVEKVDNNGQRRYYLETKTPLYTDPEHRQIWGLCGISTDITERKAVEAELERHRDHLEKMVEERTFALSIAKEAAEAASRAKSTFLANMSHELRTPLNGIMGMTELARRRASDPEQQEMLAALAQSSKHLLGIINDILDLSKIEADRLTLERSDFQLGSIFDSLKNLLGDAAAAKQLQINFDIDPVLARTTFQGDPLRLCQILLNLAGNAIKFTSAGTVTVRAEMAAREQDRVALNFEVRDTGIGIPVADQARLFKAFEQADSSITRRYGGTGLGLAICQRLVSMMGGTIGVDSEPGTGSTFWFNIPLECQPSETANEGTPDLLAEHRLRSQHAGARILIVDDEPINQVIAREFLEEAGLTTDLANDGAEALAMAGSTRYAAILMDLQMPNLDGLAATRRIRELPDSGEVPIIAMTANAFPEDRERCSAAGMNDFITKPIDHEILFTCLLKHLKAGETDARR
jgi:PAS domain S-box-containing protein